MANESDYPAKYQLEDGSGSILLETGTDYLIKEMQNYYELVAIDGAINFWPLSEASAATPAADLLGTNPGTYNNTPTMAQTGPLVGETNTAVLFDGATQDVTATGSTAYSGENGAFTIEAWLKTTATTGVWWGGVGGSLQAVTFASGTQIKLLTAFQNTVVGQLFNQNGGTLAHVLDYVSGDWVHVAMTLDVATTTARMFINGDNTSNTARFPTDFPVITAFSGTPRVWNGSSAQHIGSAGSTFLHGTMALVAVYPTALTADQIARHYRCGLQFLPDVPAPPVMIAAH